MNVQCIFNFSGLTKSLISIQVAKEHFLLESGQKTVNSSHVTKGPGLNSLI
jgi:hypothetical protein